MAIVSECDYERLSQYRWYAYNNKGQYRARANVKVDGVWKKIVMHREILQAKPGQEVDHINGDTLNNTRENLRICTHAENVKNTSKRPGSSKYKGVTLRRGESVRWKAQIGSDKRKIALGYFDTEEEAALAYNAAAIKLHGKFARINIVNEQSAAA